MTVAYWLCFHNVRYEIYKRVEKMLIGIAKRMPKQLRMWVVVDATNTARQLYPHSTGYAGPDGLGYQEIYDGALRRKTPRVSVSSPKQ